MRIFTVLLIWMKAVTDVIIYQPSVPEQHKKDLIEAYLNVEKEIKKPQPFQN